MRNTRRRVHGSGLARTDIGRRLRQDRRYELLIAPAHQGRWGGNHTPPTGGSINPLVGGGGVGGGAFCFFFFCVFVVVP